MTQPPPLNMPVLQPPLQPPRLPPPLRPSTPASIRATGVVICLFGLVLLAAIVLVDSPTLLSLRTGGEMLITRCMISGFAAACAILAVLLISGGLLLLCGRRFGRGLILAFVWAVAPIMAAGALSAGIAADAGESLADALSSVFCFHMATAGVCVLAGLVIGILLLTGSTARWADATARQKPVSWRHPSSPPRMSVGALLSLIFVFLPPPFIMQMVSIALASRSLGVIRRSGGSRHGRGMAIAAAWLSIPIVLLIVAAALLGSGLMVRDATSRNTRDDITHRLAELDLAQRLYSQLALDRSSPGAECSTSLSDLLHATAPYAPVDPDVAAMLSLADAGPQDRQPQPYHGYLFKLACQTDPNSDGSPPAWSIRAWMPTHAGPSFTLDPGGQINVAEVE